MNRKTKKQITVIAVFLFFLGAGLWYFWQTGAKESQETERELTAVLNDTEKEDAVLPEAEKTEKTEEAKSNFVVYVCGAVNSPGVYELPENSRLYEAIALAGGFSAEADPAYHNLARGIADGERIYILSVSETEELTTQQQVSGEDGAESVTGATDGLINLNTATAEQLMELPGIGEAKAESILEYRNKIGKFTAIEEIMNVSGIGEAMYEKIRDKIVVK